MNLTELLEQTASNWPQKTALIEGSTTISYSGLVQKVDEIAEKLRQTGVSPSSRVGLCLPNSIDYVALTFALWRVQAIVVPVPTECTEEEISNIADTMQLDAVLSGKSGGEQINAGSFLRRLQPAVPANNHGLNLAFIRFTSGTTNSRKGVALCHETVRDRVVAANKAFQIGAGDTVVWCLPMSHHFLITIVLYLSQGSTVVLLRQTLAKAFLEAVHQWKATVLYAAPFHYALLARDTSGVQMPSVRLAVSTTCSLPQDVAEDFRKRYQLPLSQALGIIELGLVAVSTGDPAGRWNSVGRPLPEHQLKLLNPDAEGSGEIAIRGPGFFDAYVSPWVSKEEALHDGWFRTGDIGRVDKDGYLYLIGRKNAVINLAGKKVFPEEIEAVLNRHPAVRESRVYGRPHAHLGEVVEADVVLAEPGGDLEPVRSFCRVHLASYKVPTRLHVVSSLPRTAATGKIRRAVAVV